MKTTKKTTNKSWFIELTAQQASTINGGRHGADDGPNHDLGDDKGGRDRGRGQDDGPGHT